MSKDLSGSGLFKKLDAANRERELIYEQAHQASVNRLERNLNAVNEAALATYGNAIRFYKTWLNLAGIASWSILIGLALSIGIYGAHWLALRWTERDVTILTTRKQALQEEIEAQRKTIERLKTRTWGILLHEAESDRYVVFPKNQVSDDWDGPTFFGRPAAKLKNQ